MDRIQEAKDHLGAAISQSLPSDDQTIMGHVRDAHDLLGAEIRSRRAALEANVDAQRAVQLHAEMGNMIRKAFGL